MRYGNVKVTGEHILDERDFREAEEEEEQVNERRRRGTGGAKVSYKAGAPRGALEEAEEQEETESLFSRHLRKGRARDGER
jgi:hypothetical protein